MNKVEVKLSITIGDTTYKAHELDESTEFSTPMEAMKALIDLQSSTMASMAIKVKDHE